MNLLATVCLPVQRIIAQRSLDHGRVYQVLVKWEGLPYSNCSWEDRANIDADAVQQFVLREVSLFKRFASMQVPVY
jgi:Chromo (CHRromatin Organisation MOdifier) domain